MPTPGGQLCNLSPRLAVRSFELVQADKIECYKRFIKLDTGKIRLETYLQEFKDLLHKTKALENLQQIFYMLYLFGLPLDY